MNKEVNGHDIRHQSSEAEIISETSYLHYAEDDTSSKPEFDDDEIDPALKEKIDRWDYFLTDCFILYYFKNLFYFYESYYYPCHIFCCSCKSISFILPSQPHY
ncbi:hypothetical protein V8G54_009492 [Vigna mungo]|uniref:Uncharacterized protein n=1 Tax=Vigna mungo TaxID=3915 RepID=A0AAQ3NW89_VIGMU